MRLLRSFPALAFALVFLSIVALALAQQSIPLLLVAGALAAISWYITEGPRGRSLPKWVSHILVIAVALYAVAELITHGMGDIQGVLGRFGIWLTLIKLYERRTARDHSHLLMLSFLLMLVASLQATGLLFSVILLVYVFMGLYVLLLYQLYAAHERARLERRRSMPVRVVATPSERNPTPLPPLKPIIGQHAAMNFRALVASVGLTGLVLGAVVFIMFPRGVFEDAVSSWGVTGSLQQRSRTGFTQEVNLMQGGRITDSRRSVLTVQLLDQAGEPFQFFAPLLLRGSVLERYEGDGRWGTSRMAPERLDLTPGRFAHLSSIDPQHPRTLTKVVRSRVGPEAIFSVYAPVAVSVDRLVDVSYDRRTQLLITPDRSLPPLTYRVQFQPTPSEDMLEELVQERPPGEMHNLHRLRNAEVGALARHLLNDAGIGAERPRFKEDASAYWRWAREAAQVFTRYLHSPEFRYTLDLNFVLPEDEDPISYFLFHAKRGHCEYFASALVALCENAGVESRLVTGYLANEYNETGRRYEVRQRNAHAWVEVRTGDRRWSVFDPTPPAVLQEILDEPTTLAERLQSLYDRFDVMWSHSVLAFDSRSQQRLAERWDLQLTQRLTRVYETVREWLRVANVAFSLGPAGSIYVGFVSLILILAVIVLVKLRRRSAAIRRTARLEHLRGSGLPAFWEIEYQRLLRDSGFYLELLEALERLGLAKPRWLPPLAHADEVARTHPRVAEALRDMAQLFYRSRYGRQPLTAKEVTQTKARLAHLSTQERGAGRPAESEERG